MMSSIFIDMSLGNRKHGLPADRSSVFYVKLCEECGTNSSLHIHSTPLSIFGKRKRCDIINQIIPHKITRAHCWMIYAACYQALAFAKFVCYAIILTQFQQCPYSKLFFYIAIPIYGN